MSILVTLEGIEGTGKSTLIQNLAIMLRDKDIGVTITREPGGSPQAEKIRQLVLKKGSENLDPLAELLLMYAARAQHIAETILPALNTGHIVLCDRYFDASHAYQGFGRSMSRNILQDLDKHVVKKCIPDLTLWLDAPIELCLERTKVRKNRDRFDQESIEFFTRVQKGYAQLAEDNPQRITMLDAMLSKDDLLDKAYAHIITCYKSKK
tara:strand:+ start:77 stop:703 length:627 start_codon:yes stop_codon:yes gene_type:complete